MVDCVCVLDESGWASRATLSAVPVRDSLIFVPVDLVDWGCCGVRVSVWFAWKGRRGKREDQGDRGMAYHGLAKLGVGVFAECVGHFEGFVKIVFGVVVVVVVVMETLQWNKRVFICTFYTFYT